MELDEYRTSLDAWLDEQAAVLAPTFEGSGTLDEQIEQLAKVKRHAFDAGWLRYGWPERVGGLGGSPLLRGYLGEALTARDLIEPGLYSMIEVLVPTMVDYAPADLAAAMVPRMLRGDETWCQGFSEPGTGSNLGSLSCRATADGDTWRVTGQKVWTSLAQYSQRCVLLTRTGTPESAHRGITALFVDMDSPGITVRPIETLHGVAEFAEVFFDDVVVPVERTLGEVGGGWAVAMDLLPYERSTALWHRGALMHRRLGELLEEAPDGALTPGEVGTVFLDLYAFRARSRATQHRLHAGEQLGAETSIDKVLLATAEQGALRGGRQRAGRRGPARRRGDRPAVAVRVLLLASGHDLRRQRRDPAQHHRPPPAGPRERPLMDAEDRELFDRSLRAATESHSGEKLDAALDELGWGDALAEDPEAAVSLLFEHQGATNATLVGPGPGAGRRPRRRAHRRRAAGPGRTDRPGDGGTVHGLGTAALRASSTALVATGDGLATVDTTALQLRPVDGIDPDLGLVEVVGQVAGDAAALEPEVWDAAVAAGQRALAHELVGSARTMLGLARDHAVERIQFGVPIASFQAVRHRLAESLVAIEAAEAAANAAWLDRSPLAAALAKAIAGRSGRTVARHAQQVLAGIGFTTEHDLHRHLRRTYALDAPAGRRPSPDPRRRRAAPGRPPRPRPPPPLTGELSRTGA